MTASPDVDEIIRVAASLGMSFGREEAVVYRERLLATLRATEEFMRLRVPEDRPPLLYPSREPGHRPSAEEDPYNAWYWKCEIRGAPEGLLRGKTVSFKDHVAVAGLPVTLGSSLLEGNIADFDATVVTRALAAGGTITGKNAMNGPTNGCGNGIPSDYGRPLNPHAPEHVSGGSSSGSAVAVAAGEVDLSYGGDQGGSIRLPASYCGVYGLKPTFGLVSHFGASFGADPSLDHIGPLARTAEDVARALDAVAGYDRYDQRQDRTVPDSIDSLATLKDGAAGLRIGVLEEGFGDAEPDVRDAVLAAVDVLVAAGATATRVSVPEHLEMIPAADALDAGGSRAMFDIGFFGAFANTYYPATFIAAAYALFHEHTDRLQPRRKLGLVASEYVRHLYHGTVYAKAQNVRPYFRRALDRALERFDVLAMPTCPRVAPRYEPDRPYLEAAFQSRIFVRNTQPTDYTGHPALSIPCGRSGRLPIGLQLVGRFYDDPLLLRLAYAFEHSVDWERLTALP